jgi:hypothetical protein
MSEGQQWDALPQELVMDLAQLTKANSIEGSHVLLPFGRVSFVISMPA